MRSQKSVVKLFYLGQLFLHHKYQLRQDSKRKSNHKKVFPSFMSLKLMYVMQFSEFTSNMYKHIDDVALLEKIFTSGIAWVIYAA